MHREPVETWYTPSADTLLLSIEIDLEATGDGKRYVSEWIS